MKKPIATIAFFAALGTLTVSCQKENFLEPNSIVAEKDIVYTVSYTIDGVNYQITLVGEDVWYDFLNRMFVLAEEGHKVSFCNEESFFSVALTKDTVTYSTINRDDAYKWADKKASEGYVVSIEYDRETGIYTCTATR